MMAPIYITDDAVNEATQVFILELILVRSLRVDLTARPSSLCRIIDNDCKDVIQL